MSCSYSSLLTWIDPALIQHGQDGHGTRRGMGAPPVTGMAETAKAHFRRTIYSRLRIVIKLLDMT
jgi:hypothetical protein